MQYAYPTWDGGDYLQDVQAFFGLPAPNNSKPLTAELRARLQARADSNQTTIFYSGDNHLWPYGVLEGSRFYLVQFHKGTMMHQLPKHIQYKIACMSGCGE